MFSCVYVHGKGNVYVCKGVGVLCMREKVRLCGKGFHQGRATDRDELYRWGGTGVLSTTSGLLLLQVFYFPRSPFSSPSH